MNHLKLTSERLLRTAVVYVRQSTPTQVTHNLESQRRQYGLEDRARELGFQHISVIDEDLGRTGSGLAERPGFQRLVAQVCAGEVGAVFCIEASRLARNGRDWHHLIELCGMVGAVLVDLDGVYDPNLINDRLLLGLKGTMSEFEATLIRQRSIEAIHQKASRGELWIPVPVGFCWTSNGKIEKHPDQRVQQAIHSVFNKMTELGSMRQVLIWFREHNVCLPVCSSDGGERGIIWKLPMYQGIQAILSNPVYAGAYAFGKTETRTRVVDGRPVRRSGYRRPRFAVVGLDSKPPSGLPFLGGVRTESSHDRREHSYAVRRRAKGGPRRPGSIVRAAALPTLWTNVVRRLFRAASHSDTL
jgi:DNA invertase Pin-like site-specific DNA recombinase